MKTEIFAVDSSWIVNKGKTAFEHGLDAQDNPYTNYSWESYAWLEGFNCAAKEYWKYYSS